MKFQRKTEQHKSESGLNTLENDKQRAPQLIAQYQHYILGNFKFIDLINELGNKVKYRDVFFLLKECRDTMEKENVVLKNKIRLMRRLI
jgi:hypothetical protein